jgi:hypothetical protein
MSDNEYMVTQKEAADFLNVSTKSISRYRKRGLPYKLILNPVTGKQEVRFRYADLERWDEGRQLLATYARDGEEVIDHDGKSGRVAGQQGQANQHDGFLNDLLFAYKEQIELLRDQLEDMREQLARRDRQIDDLMRLMVGLQLEYKPMPAVVPTENHHPGQQAARRSETREENRFTDLYETVKLPESVVTMRFPDLDRQDEGMATLRGKEKKVFSREQLAASIQRLRRKGKSYEEIARGLNQIDVATLSGHPEWNTLEVKNLLPALVEGTSHSFPEE